ncbi:Fumarate reductase subunit C [compost metagenome]
MIIVPGYGLAAALLHTKTWFELAPKAANIIVKNEKLGPEPIIKGLWVVTAVVTVVILGVALFW